MKGVFDPLGFPLGPRLPSKDEPFSGELTAGSSRRDDPLPEDKLGKWQAWQDLLKDLRNLHILRTNRATSLASMCRALCVRAFKLADPDEDAENNPVSVHVTAVSING